MLKRSSVIASPGTRPLGTDPRFRLHHRRRASGHSVLQILEQVDAAFGKVELGISVITVAELTHGAYRAQSSAQQQRRLAFIDRLCKDVPVYSVTLDIARLVGRFEAELMSRGFTPSFEDLAVGVTALQLGFSVATGNVKHFKLIPGLNVVTI